MSKIKWNLPVALLMAVTTAAAQAQTLGELAELQRQKMDADSKPKQEATIKSVPKIKKESTPEPNYTLHSIYTRKGNWVAEVTDGQNLVAVKTGFQVGRFRVLEITDSGIVLRNAKTSKSVPIGGRF